MEITGQFCGVSFLLLLLWGFRKSNFGCQSRHLAIGSTRWAIRLFWKLINSTTMDQTNQELGRWLGEWQHLPSKPDNLSSDHQNIKTKNTHPPGSTTCQCSCRGMEVVVTGESQGASRPANLVSTALKKPVSGRRYLWSPHVGYDMPIPTHSHLFLIHRETQRILRKWGSEVSITMTTRCPQPISQWKGVFLSFVFFVYSQKCMYICIYIH